jgi:hypothetical protein
MLTWRTMKARLSGEPQFEFLDIPQADIASLRTNAAVCAIYEAACHLLDAEPGTFSFAGAHGELDAAVMRLEAALARTTARLH